MGTESSSNDIFPYFPAPHTTAAICPFASEQPSAPLPQSSYLHLCLRAAICTSASEQLSAPLPQSSHLHFCLRAAICTSQNSHLHLCLRAAICTSASEQPSAPLPLRAAICTSASEQPCAPLPQSSYLHLCPTSEQPSAPLPQISHLRLCLPHHHENFVTTHFQEAQGSPSRWWWHSTPLGANQHCWLRSHSTVQLRKPFWTVRPVLSGLSYFGLGWLVVFCFAQVCWCGSSLCACVPFCACACIMHMCTQECVWVHVRDYFVCVCVLLLFLLNNQYSDNMTSAWVFCFWCVCVCKCSSVYINALVCLYPLQHCSEAHQIPLSQNPMQATLSSARESPLSSGGQ